jgi:hypothetical protein
MSNIPEQRIDPPEIPESNEHALEIADVLLGKIYKLNNKAESFFEELTVSQLENLWADAEYYLDQLKDLYNENYIGEDEYNTGRWMVEEIENWFHEKEEEIKLEDK